MLKVNCAYTTYGVYDLQIRVPTTAVRNLCLTNKASTTSTFVTTLRRHRQVKRHATVCCISDPAQTGSRIRLLTCRGLISAAGLKSGRHLMKATLFLPPSAAAAAAMAT